MGCSIGSHHNVEQQRRHSESQGHQPYREYYESCPPSSTDDVGFDWKYNGYVSENETNAIIIVKKEFRLWLNPAIFDVMYLDRRHLFVPIKDTGVIQELVTLTK